MVTDNKTPLYSQTLLGTWTSSIPVSHSNHVALDRCPDVRRHEAVHQNMFSEFHFGEEVLDVRVKKQMLTFSSMSQDQGKFSAVTKSRTVSRVMPRCPWVCEAETNQSQPKAVSQKIGCVFKFLNILWFCQVPFCVCLYALHKLKKTCDVTSTVLCCCYFWIATCLCYHWM